jgi:hypothetical protein
MKNSIIGMDKNLEIYKEHMDSAKNKQVAK